jgi:hypothetical protein
LHTSMDTWATMFVDNPYAAIDLLLMRPWQQLQ